jgi:hypothetical protein
MMSDLLVRSIKLEQSLILVTERATALRLQPYVGQTIDGEDWTISNGSIHLATSFGGKIQLTIEALKYIWSAQK